MRCTGVGGIRAGSGTRASSGGSNPEALVTPIEAVEQAAIRMAAQYAEENGLRGDRRVIGLVLAALAIGAGCSPATRSAIELRYRDTFPDVVPALDAWIAVLDQAANS